MSDFASPDRPATDRAAAGAAQPPPDAPEPSTERSATEKPSSTQTDIATTEEIGGPKGPEPTRFGDWERKGRCIDF